jgi:hypothetical protein
LVHIPLALSPKQTLYYHIEVNALKIMTALKHILKPHPKFKGSSPGVPQKIKYMLTALTTAEIRNITQNEKPSEE